MHNPIAVLLVAALTLLTGVAASAQEAKPPLIVFTPAAGPMAAEHPFDLARFGKTSGYSVARDTRAPRVLLYTRNLSAGCLALAKRLEALAAATPGMAPPFIHVFDAKGAQRGGYAAEELSARIAELKRLAADNKLMVTSIGVAANAGATAQVGLEGAGDLAIILLTRGKDAQSLPMVSWYRVTSTKGLTPEKVADLEASLRAAIR